MTRSLTVLSFAAIAIIGVIARCQEGSADGTAAPDPVSASPPPTARAPMQLGAASNFSQGWDQRTYDAARRLPVLRLRDSIRWANVEKVRGQYRFEGPTTSYPDRADIHLTLTLNWGNPLYDNGKTPHSQEALKAFGHFAAEVVKRFPQVDTLEVGNEVNGTNFVSGPVKTAGLARRADYHLAMVRAAADSVHAVRPEVTVIGGATHSLPAGYLWTLLDKPGAHALQGLAVHPYTTPIDQLPAQMAVLRRHPRARALPIHVTEVGSQNEARAPDDLMRSYAMLAALGVAEMDWYPLNERGDGMVPLIARGGAITPTGRAFQFIQQRLSGHVARAVSPDPFSSVIAFGDRVQVLWGAPRSVVINAQDVDAYDATGVPVSPNGLNLAEDRALVLVGRAKPLDVKLGCSPWLADSLHQFSYPPDRPQGFKPYFRVNGQEKAFETMPGQQRPGVPWTPYLGHRDYPALRLTADTMLPVFGQKPGAIVHRYTADQNRTIRIRAEFTPPGKGRDKGRAIIVLERDGKAFFESPGTLPVLVDRQIALRKGETLALAASLESGSTREAISYSVRLSEGAAECRGPISIKN